uniref:Sortilin n=1 Tax=Macrostomum lignano TaxID=282301 RepID=A0A1I8I4X0_9PLAT
MTLASALFIHILLGLSFIAATESNACEKQQSDISVLLSDSTANKKFLSEFVFANDSKPKLQITWAGPNSKTLIALTLVSYVTTSTLADVYRSTDDGRSFSRITAQVSPGVQPLQLLTQYGLQRNPGNSSQLYLASAGSTDATTNLHMSFDNGATWQTTVLPFALTQAFMFHQTQKDLALAHSGSTLFLTRDGGLSWTRLKDQVVKASWGSATDQANSIYAVVDQSISSDKAVSLGSVVRNSGPAARIPKPSRSLLKTINFGDIWRPLADNIFSYVGRENFLFLSLADTYGLSRRLAVSTDYGASFHRTSLPSISPDSFASLMDVANGLAFVYVDSGRLNGYGTLYTSDATGRLFSKSLERQFYPPGDAIGDFYRVESMPGTYLTTVMDPDLSLVTRISHNRGADWMKLQAPSGECLLGEGAGSGSCQLQLVSAYSIARVTSAQMPVSLATAPGLLIAHGNTGASVQTSSPSNVYLSNNGGHTWSKVLEGPHFVQLGNNGGFIAAVAHGNSGPQVMKFSTDAGRCWHSYKFTSEEYRFTGFVSEPGSRATSVAIWGFSSLSQHWRVFVLDFAAILTRECSASDYEPWLANGALSYSESSNSSSGSSERGCVFGAKQTIMRLKPDSLCANNYSYTPSQTVEPCNCTKADFGCEFGYKREFSGRDCVRDPGVPELDVCTDEDSVQRVLTDGYRKLPGNLCSGGFAPNRTEQTALQGKRCSELLKRQRERADAAEATKLAASSEAAAKLAAQLAKADAEAEANNRRRLVAVLLPVSAILGGLVCAVLALVLAAKLRERRRQLAAFHYSAVSAAGRCEDVESLSNSTTTPAPTRSGGGGGGGSRRADDKQQLLLNPPEAEDEGATAVDAAPEVNA